jgi:hypothetical protein
VGWYLVPYQVFPHVPGGHRFEPPRTQPNLYAKWRGCHVAAHVWATWSHNIIPPTFHLSSSDRSNSHSSHPPHQPLPCYHQPHVIMTLPHVQCGPATCPVQPFHISNTTLPCQQCVHAISAVQTCHVSTVQTVQSTKFYLFGKSNRT